MEHRHCLTSDRSSLHQDFAARQRHIVSFVRIDQWGNDGSKVTEVSQPVSGACKSSIRDLEQARARSLQDNCKTRVSPLPCNLYRSLNLGVGTSCEKGRVSWILRTTDEHLLVQQAGCVVSRCNRLLHKHTE